MYNRAGPCLILYPLDPPGHTLGASGFRGPSRNFGFRKTPGFSRTEVNVPAAGRRADGKRRRVREVLVYGRAPERATAVVILIPGRVSIDASLQEGPTSIRGDFYGVAVKPPLRGARINWFDEKGRPGSRGIRLMPRSTR